MHSVTTLCVNTPLVEKGAAPVGGQTWTLENKCESRQLHTNNLVVVWTSGVLAGDGGRFHKLTQHGVIPKAPGSLDNQRTEVCVRVGVQVLSHRSALTQRLGLQSAAGCCTCAIILDGH